MKRLRRVRASVPRSEGRGLSRCPVKAGSTMVTSRGVAAERLLSSPRRKIEPHQTEQCAG